MSPNLRAHLALIGATILWGSSFTTMKVAVGAFGPLPVVWMRMFLATLLFFGLVPSLRRVRPTRRDWSFIVLMALFEPCLYFIFEGYALRLTTSAQAGTVAAMLPLMMAVSAGFILKEKIAKATIAGFVLSVLGVVWLTLGSSPDESAPNPMLGNFLEFLAMASAIGYMTAIKKLSSRYSPWFLTAMQAAVGSVFFLPAAVVLAPSAVAGYEPVAALNVLYLASAVTIGGYGFYNYGMSILPANQAAGYINVIPVVAVLLGWMFLGEAFSAQQCFAALLVFAGIVLSQRQGSAAQAH